MADRDGLGDLPLFDTEVRPVREFVAQEQRQEDDYQYITRMYSALGQTDSGSDSKIFVIRWNTRAAGCLMNIWIERCCLLWWIRFMIRSIIKRSKIVRRKNSYYIR